MDDRDNGFEDEEEFQDLIQARATTKPTRWWNSARYTLVFMAFLGFSNVYAMRVNLSVAIVSMVNHTAINSHQPAPNSNDTDVCPIPPGENHTSHLPPDGPFVWDEARQGLVLGSFFYGYVVTQYPGGRLAEHFGAKWIFGIGILITSVFTLLTPIAAQTDLILLIVVRVIEGLGEGVTFPVMLVLLAQWAPPQERSKMTSFAYGGAAFGTILAMPLTGLICDCLGWEAVFYVFGVLGVLWFVAWCFLCYDSPESHPRINEDEKIYILSSLNQDPTGGTGARHRSTLATPWIPLLTSGPFYAILATHVFQSFGYYVLLTELPTYMTNILRYDIKSNALLSAVPYIFAWLVSILSPILADFLIRRETLTKTWTRKAFNTLATVGPALSLIGAAYSGCNYVLTIFLLTLAVATNGAIYSGEQSNMLDMAPDFAGTIMGITNTISNFMGFIAPQNGDGFISAKELGVLMRTLGRNPTEDEIMNIMNEIDIDHNGKLDFSEFTMMMRDKLANEDMEMEIKQAFRVFDRNGDGYISKIEFKHCMMHFGEQFTDEEVEEMISEADSNKDGKIDYTEFSEMILKEINIDAKTSS